MRLNVLIAGKAGQGIKQTASILAKAIVEEGLYVFNYRYYQSLITGGHNFNVLSISDEEVMSFDRDYDIAILLDENSLMHEKNFKKECVVLKSFEKGKGKKIDTTDFKKVENIFFSSILFKILGLGKERLIEQVRRAFKGKKLLKKDLEIIEKAYKEDFFEKLKVGRKFKKKSKKKIYLEGAEAVGIGAIESGLDVYLAYPMTPSTSLLNFLSMNQKKHGYITFQPENEISVVNAGLGSSFSGAKIMIGTSGGGFDLMTEAISMQGMTSLPLVVYLASRYGPSSGAATYTAQQDLKLALNAGHGDFKRVVIAPGDIKESYECTKQAFYLAEKYGLLSIVLTDKHLAESGYTQEIKYKELYEGKKNKLEKVFKSNSYTHDEEGNYTEDADKIKKMTEKRKKRWENAKKEIKENFNMYKKYGNGRNLILGFGSTKGAILSSLSSLKNWKYIHITYLQPFPEKLKKEILKAEKVKVIENNIYGQLADLIQEKTGRKIKEKDRILRYDARPFTPKEIVKRLK